MRRIAILLVSALLLTTPSETASASNHKKCIAGQVNNDDDDQICSAEGSGSSPGSQQLSTSGASGSGGPGGGSGGGSSSQTRYLPYDRLTTGPDGQPCMTTGYHAEGTSPSDGVPANPANPQPFIYANLAESYPPCPEQPGQPPALETASMVAARYWERIPLPKPRPTIAPGRAITGKIAYLETGGRVTDTYYNDTVLGRLSIIATGYYTVDWGDGTVTGPYRHEGMPWPHGQITHTYQNVGSYNIVVTERWTSTWQLDGESGVLRELRTTGRIDNFPVEQIQAVIGR
jgi:hypothetical protein